MDTTKRANVERFLTNFKTIANAKEKTRITKNLSAIDLLNSIIQLSSPEFMDRQHKYCSWFIPNMKMIDEISSLQKKVNLPIYDIGCGYGLFTLLLNYLDIPCIGYDNENELSRKKFSERKEILINLLKPFDITYTDNTIKIADINDIVTTDFIFFQAWGRSTDTVDRYVSNGGKYVIIVGEPEGGCTTPNADYIGNQNTKDIIIPNHNTIHDWVTITIIE